ncbi:shikimate kinase [Novosphingobium sediminicola]|uniref:Shikimate kinase n=1 Tax=Novosphingobium sediminicola TaxID=563162 RepID=A0A7W6CI39_9SPHN|nr:shikimate kinase [Novosphingobium sediminicola]MBB3953481.1 shikimate kinase [Novosphingobium sediminicola]
MDEDHTLSESAAEAVHLAAVLAHIDRPIVLVGMMGVGKTSLGRRLAALLGVPFVDADDEIEKAAHMPIPDIFATYGEAFFREGERRVIARLLGENTPGDAIKGLKLPHAGNGKAGLKVLSTGGGAFVNDATRELILARGIAVWLDAELETLVDRTARKGNRPLLKTGNPREILSNLKSSREPFYSQAPIKVMSGNVPHSRTLASLMVSLDEWLDAHGAKG